jgi:hypothetical protein
MAKEHRPNTGNVGVGFQKRGSSDKPYELSARAEKYKNLRIAGVDENGKPLSKTECARLAGFKNPDQYALRLEANPLIRDAIDEARKKASEKAQITMETITSRLNEIALRCMEAVPVRNKDGEPTGVYTFDANAAIKANIELARHLGLEPAKKVDLTSGGERLEVTLNLGGAAQSNED